MMCTTLNIFQIFYDEIISFFGIGRIIEISKSGDYSSLLTLDGVFSIVSPLMPLLLLIEIGRALFYKRFKIEDYKVPFIIFIVNRFISRFISIAAIIFCIGLLEPHAIFKSSIKWYWLIYGYIVW